MSTIKKPTINSRSKGARGEKKAIEVITQWTKRKFARVPASGGLNWHNSNSTGDIVCVEEGIYIPFTIEVKNYGSVNFDHVFYLNNCDVNKFWEQALRDAKRVNKCPMLMIRYNNLPKDLFFIAVDRTIFNKFFKPHLNLSEDIVMITQAKGWAMFTTETLLKVPYKAIRKEVRLYLKQNPIK